MNDSRNLRVLSAAAAYTSLVDTLARPGMRGEERALFDQWRRAVSSVEANIAEAARLGTARNMARQLRIALASATEARQHLRRLRTLSLLAESDARHVQSRHAVVCRMLVHLLRRVEEQEARQDDARRASP